MPDFSLTSADEFRTNTPYLLIETLKVGREGVLMHPLLAPRVRRPTTSLGQAPGPGSGGAVLGVVLQESGKPHTGKWPRSLWSQAPGPRHICSSLVGASRAKDAPSLAGRSCGGVWQEFQFRGWASPE